MFGSVEGSKEGLQVQFVQVYVQSSLLRLSKYVSREGGVVVVRAGRALILSLADGIVLAERVPKGESVTRSGIVVLGLVIASLCGFRQLKSGSS